MFVRRKRFFIDTADGELRRIEPEASESFVMHEDADFKPLDFNKDSDSEDKNVFRGSIVQNWICRIIKEDVGSVHLYMRNEEKLFASREVVMSRLELSRIIGFKAVHASIFRIIIESYQLEDGKKVVRKRIENVRHTRLFPKDIDNILDRHLAVLSFLKEDKDGDI